MSSRDTFKYHYKVGNKIVHTGITDSLDRREREHQNRWPKGHISQQGHAVTESSAREWENEQRERGRPTETPKRK